MISYYKNSKGDLFLTDDVCTCAYTQEANYDSAGDLTKVRVVRVCSCAGHKESGDKVLSRKSFNEWVPTKTITWFDDNSQRMRDEKLKQLLVN